jgi:O-antigen/teichoic acid export membrane protein
MAAQAGRWIRSATPPRPTTPARTDIRDNLNIVLRQFLTLSAGEGVARGLHALAFLALARSVGPQALGEFGVAQAVASYGLLAVQRGLDVPAMLRVAQAPERADALRAALVRLRLPVFAVLLAGAAIWRNWLVLAMAGMWLAAAVQVRWLLIARQQSAAVAGAAILAAGVFLAAALAGVPLVWVALSLSVGELAAAGWYWLAAGGKWTGRAGLDGELERESWPFLASLLLGNLLYNLDVFVLGAMRLETEVGLYVAAYRLITVFSPVLGALQNSSLPLFGKLYPDKMSTDAMALGVWTRSVSVAVGIALVLGLTPAVLAFLYGSAFMAAAPLVPVFALVLPIQVTRMVYRQALLAFRGQQRDLQNLGWAVGVNLGMDLALAPAFGAMGCAISTVCAESVFAFLTWRAWRRLTCA